ncbi:hypothetical protein RJ639_035771 [Escallonia herrerae]|uniref:Homeobox-leucine zipper protein n=1 Tax=Escallonia herrerae TaxID=1293975 RepID=A0AA89BBB2_9ASTE|nr:hypothetical protein RJ639_035771 [Escallonia herrerae]
MGFTNNFGWCLHAGASILMRRSMSFSGNINQRCDEMRPEADDDMSDDGSQLGEKKRRLNLDQVKALEKSFEVANKLEPERKVQLARALGLQPRQVAIWFQNRRARWKTKQLERDYDLLKKQFQALKAENDALKTQNSKLHGELLALKGREPSNGTRAINLNQETDQGSWSNGSENSCDVNTRTPSADSPLHSHPRNTYVFPSAMAPTGLSQLLQSSSTPDESLSTMFNGIDDQPGFWPWPEQQHFH